ncbi:hypothetical protein PROFUN_07251 [Planoprotostelium fungivorum]|uniref:NADH dehydrogenase [ubiquinone] 1 beta subcomplex subunit 7 n=1 Tax=Planoprotostelium fungivorum TaxID=1890364 RepID=A0A2P6NM67_9EUKA|nr:hypothetical protein PROFUN_07251 [Planoprotostelium fungivorum]
MADRPPPPISREEMKVHDIPLAWRDHCAHLLVPLNQCRQKSFYMPWKCTHERHEYEICEHSEWAARQEKRYGKKPHH